MARLGCGTWRAMLQCRGGAPLVEVPWQHLTMGRRVDEISSASVTITAAGLGALSRGARRECAGVLRSIRPWQHELALYRGDHEAWVGPIMEPDFGPTSVTLPARDLTQWWERRVLGRDRSWESVDLSTAFERYVIDAMQPDPTPNIRLQTTPTGIVGKREIKASAHRRAADALRELARSGVDYTAYGRTVLAGGTTVPWQHLGTFITEHFDQPHLVVHGLLGTTQAAVIGARTSTGEPIVGQAGGGDDALGLLQTVATESGIADQGSADAAAQTRLDLLLAPDYMTGVLQQNAPVDFANLVPGATAWLKVEAMCREADALFRLLALDAAADLDEEGHVTEKVTPTFTLPGTEAA